MKAKKQAPDVEALILDAIKPKGDAPIRRADQAAAELDAQLDKLMLDIVRETMDVQAPKALRDAIAAAMRRAIWLAPSRHFDLYCRCMTSREHIQAAERIARVEAATAPPAAQKAPKAAKVVESDEGRAARLQALYDDAFDQVVDPRVSGLGISDPAS